MAVRFDIAALLAVSLVLGCAEEGNPQSPRELDEDELTDEENSATADAGSKKDSGGGKKDAASNDEDDDTGDDDTGDDDAADDDSDDDTGGDDDTGTMNDAGASKDAGRNDAAPSAGDTAAGGSCDGLSYSSFGMKFFSTYCTSCHGGDEPMADLGLESLADVTAHKEDIVDRAVTKKNMPPRGSKAPTDAERANLKKWIDCGPK